MSLFGSLFDSVDGGSRYLRKTCELPVDFYCATSQKMLFIHVTFVRSSNSAGETHIHIGESLIILMLTVVTFW